MTPNLLYLPILLPALLAAFFLALPSRVKLVREVLATAGAAVLLAYGFVFFFVKNLELSVPWLGMGIDF
ncbi:MAG: hypothetical protein MUP28_00725, partial [Candidatus Aminicenantes bacterium]|nr:hypothetical protein [Candidatus Aminicenantes bacterium]